MLFRFDTEGRPLTIIYNKDICLIAAFKLDKPLLCTTETVFLLEKGQWFMIIADEPKLIAGRWVLII